MRKSVSKLFVILTISLLGACGQSGPEGPPPGGPQGPPTEPPIGPPTTNNNDKDGDTEKNGPDQWLACGPFVVVPADGSDNADLFDSKTEAFAEKSGEVAKDTVFKRDGMTGLAPEFYGVKVDGEDGYLKKKDVLDTCPASGPEVVPGYLVLKDTEIREELSKFEGTITEVMEAPPQPGDKTCAVEAGTVIEYSSYIERGGWDVAKIKLAPKEAARCGFEKASIGNLEAVRGLFYFGQPSDGLKYLAALRKLKEAESSESETETESTSTETETPEMEEKEEVEAPEAEAELESELKSEVEKLKAELEKLRTELKEKKEAEPETPSETKETPRNEFCGVDEKHITLNGKDAFYFYDESKRLDAMRSLVLFGACSTPTNSKCGVDDKHITIDGKDAFYFYDEAERKAALQQLVILESCSTPANSKCGVDEKHITIDGKDAFYFYDETARFHYLNHLVQEGVCSKATNSRCAVDQKDITVNGKDAFYFYDESDRLMKLVELVKAGLCS